MKMNKKLLFGAFLFAFAHVNGQVQNLGTPLSWKDKVSFTKKSMQMDAIDNSIEAQNEYSRRANSHEKNLRFGKEIDVDIDFMQASEVKTLPNGTVVRQLEIVSPNAFSINLIFDQFHLSPSAKLYLFDKNQTDYIGAHTALNNNLNNAMGTELIYSDHLRIELSESIEDAGTSKLNIGTVVHGYLNLDEEVKLLNSSGNCEYDVNCPVGVGWENQRNAVAMMVNGGGFCTGSLVNNTSGTIIPYFLSANHCGTTPASWVFRFRWERAAGQTYCGVAPGSANGPETMNINGGTLRASYAPSDFTLTELNSTPNPAWGVYYNGWNRTDIPALSAVGIHHPAGDIKKISFENDPLISTTFGSSPADSHWGVTEWDIAVTEGGSSGSPLFDQNHRTVGQLHGGASACGNGPGALSDEYGKLFTSWTGGGSNTSRLSNWLDPSNTGATVIDGVDPAGPGTPIDAGVSAATGVSGVSCSGTVNPSVTIVNSGTSVLTSATITFGFDGNYNQVFNWTGSLNQYQTQAVSLPTNTLAGGNHTFQATVSNPNGAADGNAGNNVVNSSFYTMVNPENITYNLLTDCYGDEITWSIKDNSGSITFFTGGPYTQNSTGTTINQTFCLSQGCYKITINDSYGDGLSSSGCTARPAGSYAITAANGDTLVQLTTAQANFGTSSTKPFCVGTNGINEYAQLQENWNIYPNPATENVNIVLNEVSGAKEIALLSPTGQIIQAIATEALILNIPISGLSNGMYFVRLTTEAGTSIKRLMIK